jgi:hypothetical protein
MDKRWLLAVMVVGILTGVLNVKTSDGYVTVCQGPGQQEDVWLIFLGK